jgi:hypothetical protein
VGTFLTNSKMSPELRARIEASVRGHASTSRSPTSLRLRSGLRLLTALLVIGAVLGLLHQWQARKETLATMRSQLHEEHERVVAPLATTPALVASLRKQLAEASGDYPGDLRDRGLDEPNALADLLARPFVYARGPLGAFVDRIDEAAAESTKDAFLTCLMDSPRSTAERDLVPAVERAYRGGAAVDEATPGAHRLHDLLASQRFLEPVWATRIEEAGSATELASLRDQLERAHLGRAARVAGAEILLYVIDEPTRPGTPTELDGASDHLVRVGIVEIASHKTLLRARRRVDPAWISEAKRIYLARGLLDCRLATDLRAELPDTH